VFKANFYFRNFLRELVKQVPKKKHYSKQVRSVPSVYMIKWLAAIPFQQAVSQPKPRFMELEGSPPHSQKHATGSYPELYKNPAHTLNSIYDSV
jgi:hypothetical protein